jgi:hypothetical protein
MQASQDVDLVSLVSLLVLLLATFLISPLASPSCVTPMVQHRAGGNEVIPVAAGTDFVAFVRRGDRESCQGKLLKLED